MGNDDPREEVPMTAELMEDVWSRTRGRDWTWADLERLPERDGHRYEIIDGSLHVSASPTPWHQIVALELVVLLRATRPADLLVLSEVDIDFDHSVLEPDVLVVQASSVTSHVKRMRPEDVVLVVEVESRSSRRMDRLAKPSVYAAAGIPHYWRVCLDDPDAPAVVVSVLDGEVYREIATVATGKSVVVEEPFPVQLRPAELVVPGRGV
jgi:Uma2 family endonuclease